MDTNKQTQKIEINTVKLTIPAAVLALQNSIFIQEKQ